ncbi:MAG: STAS-like domain-containing protein [Fibrobacter sp.]|nr:STAS-like domain-containing protein [Fibrobacter sp.]
MSIGEKITDIITIQDLSKPDAVNGFIASYLHRKNRENFTIDFSDVQRVYPNAIVPIFAYIEALKKEGKLFTIIPPRDPNVSSIFSVRELETIYQADSPLSKIWRFNVDNIHIFVNRLMDCISGLEECSPGVLGTIEWSINEVMDNVPEHSGVDSGLVMAQFHKTNKRIVISVADTGIGFKASFARSHLYHPNTDADAITLAMRKGITSSDDKGRGNGLYGLHKLVMSTTNGHLRICSDKGMITIEQGIMLSPSNSIRPLKTGGNHSITTVDFQLPLDENIDIAKALDGYEPPLSRMRTEKYETDDGDYVFPLNTESHGFATRQEGRKVRIKIENLRKEIQSKRIILDFSNILIISSSYADEVIGKLVEKYGFDNFNKYFTLSNIDHSVESLLNFAISNRIRNSFSEDIDLSTEEISSRGLKGFIRKILLKLAKKLN